MYVSTVGVGCDHLHVTLEFTKGVRDRSPQVGNLGMFVHFELYFLNV